MKTLRISQLIVLLLLHITLSFAQEQVFEINTMFRNPITKLELTSNQTAVIAGDEKGHVFIYALDEGNLTNVVKTFSNPVTGLFFDASNQILISVSKTGEIYFRKVNQKEFFYQTNTETSDEIKILKFRGYYFFSAGNNIYRLSEFGELQTFPSQGGTIRALQIFNNRQLIVFTEMGAYRFNPVNGRSRNLNITLAGLEIKHTFQEKNRSVWYVNNENEVCNVRSNRLRQRDCRMFAGTVFPDFRTSSWIEVTENGARMQKSGNMGKSQVILSGEQFLTAYSMTLVTHGFIIQANTAGRIAVWRY